MVPAQWWTTVFDAMYLKTDGDMVEDVEVTKDEVGMLERDAQLKSVFLTGSKLHEAPGKILDLCSGQGRHSIFLAKKYPYLELFGHDQSPFLISLAQERARELKNKRRPVFTVGDCREIPYPSNSFNLVMVMGNSFGYFSSEDDDKAVLEEIHRVLSPDGLCVLDIVDGHYMRRHFIERSWEWIDDNTFVCRERELSKDGLRLSAREVITSTTRGVLRDQFYQERLYSEAEIVELALSVGFDVIVQPEATDSTVTTVKSPLLSKRQEDLGMMGHRMMIMLRKLTKPIQPVGVSVDFEGTEGLNVSPTLLVPTQSLPSSTPLPTNATNNSSSVSTSSSTSLLTTLIKTPRNVKPVFDHLVVVMGDPSQPCFGKLNNTWNHEDITTRQRLIEALNAIGYVDNMTLLERHDSLYQNLKSLLRANPHRVVLNLCDEGFDNDALKELHVPAILEILRIPYTGAGPNCLAHCYDKGLVNSTARALGVPTPREVFFLSSGNGGCKISNGDGNCEGNDALNQHLIVGGIIDGDVSRRLAATIEREVGFPAFIKPIRGDNSLGITSKSIIRNTNDLQTCLDELRDLGIRDITAQEYLRGTEYGVGMIGNVSIDGKSSGFRFLPILEVDFEKVVARGLAPILGFESKWDPSSPYWSEIGYKAAKLPPEIEQRLRDACVTLWERFGCRDYARFDWRCDVGRGDGLDGLGGTIKLLEVNPNPGWCWDGKLAYMAKMDGLEYKDVLSLILQSAKDRLVQEGQIS